MSRENPALHAHLAKKKKLTTFDKVITGAAFLYPITGIAQVAEVWNGNIGGVSLLSWIGFLGFSSLFFSYGVMHGVRPMIISNFIWMFVDASVIIGYLTVSMA